MASVRSGLLLLTVALAAIHNASADAGRLLRLGEESSYRRYEV